MKYVLSPFTSAEWKIVDDVRVVVNISLPGKNKSTEYLDDGSFNVCLMIIWINILSFGIQLFVC